MDMREQMKKRTLNLAVDVWKMCNKLPKSREYNAYVNQLIRCSSSVGANYRASQRGKSMPDFINKLKIVEEEADELLYFLELLYSVNPNLNEVIAPLQKETKEILSIIVAAIKTSRTKINLSKQNRKS